MFLDRLRNASPNNAYVMELFDVSALYTDVSNNSSLQTTHELLIHQGTPNMYCTWIQQLLVIIQTARRMRGVARTKNK
ncbi:hypothetical protein KIN20_001950 [Parelaphostrongylus tenuis]|uniref:Uncharacterized protein n=1 Tax=Parelaphostrongylus tenuis TaxID=148309 RepID=A0AAD5LZ49_PARTN|nr:hypothetical protein KIN20_001950 [Parelaphostrongylus tenuis]